MRIISNNHILLASALALTTGLSGCSKFLEKEPDNRAKLDSPEKVAQLMASAYPKANYQLFTELSSDNAADLITGNTGVPDWDRLNSDVYFFNVARGAQDNEDNQEGYWFGAYKAIGVANQALEAIGNATTNRAAYQPYKGEALVARAYAHFMLVNFFSKFYNTASSSTDPGIPYVTVPETESVKQYSRGTVQGVYDLVEKDLLEGIALIDDNSYSVPKYHFTKTAAYAFASRFYLYKKDYAKVIQYANLSIAETAIRSSLRPWNTVLNTLPLNGNGSLGRTYSASNQKANLLLVETQSWWMRILGLGRYGANRAVVNAATGTDPITGGPLAFSAAQYVSGHLFVPKLDEYFVETSIGSGIGNGWQMIPLLTAEEVLFNMAEAYTYSSQSDKAIALLNSYLSARIESYNSTTHALTAAKITTGTGISNIQNALVELILYYRRIEFLHEGLRWFDILRYSIPVTHTQLGGTGSVLRTETLTATDLRRVFQLPATTAESGLEANPR